VGSSSSSSSVSGIGSHDVYHRDGGENDCRPPGKKPQEMVTATRFALYISLWDGGGRLILVVVVVLEWFVRTRRVRW